MAAASLVDSHNSSWSLSGLHSKTRPDQDQFFLFYVLRIHSGFESAHSYEGQISRFPNRDTEGTLAETSSVNNYYLSL